MSKKIFFIFLIFLMFFSSFANAIVVSDLEQIYEGNQKMIENNAVLTSEVSQLKEQLASQKAILEEMNKDMFRKSDVAIIGYHVNVAMAGWQKDFLIMFLFVVVFAFAILFYGKSKGWF